jgi:hypothetical protein
MTSETLTIEALERWVDSGAHSQVVETSNNRIAVDLCACTGEPLARLESGDPGVIGLPAHGAFRPRPRLNAGRGLRLDDHGREDREHTCRRRYEPACPPGPWAALRGLRGLRLRSRSSSSSIRNGARAAKARCPSPPRWTRGAARPALVVAGASLEAGVRPGERVQGWRLSQPSQRRTSPMGRNFLPIARLTSSTAVISRRCGSTEPQVSPASRGSVRPRAHCHMV